MSQYPVECKKHRGHFSFPPAVCVECCDEQKDARIAALEAEVATLKADRDKVFAALGNGADETLWPSGIFYADAVRAIVAQLADERRVRGQMEDVLSAIEDMDCQDDGPSDRTCFYAGRKPMCTPCEAKAALSAAAKLEAS